VRKNAGYSYPAPALVASYEFEKIENEPGDLAKQRGQEGGKTWSLYSTYGPTPSDRSVIREDAGKKWRLEKSFFSQKTCKLLEKEKKGEIQKCSG